MSDRLKDLQRQRALAQEQLAWLDREIARETGATATAPTPPAAPAAPAPVTPANADAARLADEILARYKDEAASSPGDVKRGCYLYFALAFVLLGLGLVALYFYSASRR